MRYVPHPTNEVGTPRPFFELIHREYSFTVDAAASHENHLLPVYWTREENALLQDWSGHRVFCNPPYSDPTATAYDWVEKGLFESRRGATVVFLLRGWTESAWYHQLVLPHAAEVLFVKGRLSFQSPAFKAPNSALWNSIVAVFRPGRWPLRFGVIGRTIEEDAALLRERWHGRRFITG